MLGTLLGPDPWCRRHAWISALAATQAVLLAGAILIRHGEIVLALGAAITMVGPILAGRLRDLPRPALAAVSATTLVAQASLLIVALGAGARAHVLLLAVLCVIALYEVSWVFAVTFAAITLITEFLGLVDPTLIGLQAGDQQALYTAMLSGALATGVGAMAVAAVWVEHRRLRHVADEERRVSQAYLGVSGSVVIVMDPNGVVTAANRQACLTLDREEDDIVGRDWYELAVPEESREEARRLYRYAFTQEVDIFGGDYANYENEVLTSSGERRTVGWWATMLHDRHGRLTGMVCAGTDRTEMRATKAALERTGVELVGLRRLAQKVASLDDARQAIVDAISELTGAPLAGIAEPDRTGESLTYSTFTDPRFVGQTLPISNESSYAATAFASGIPQFAGRVDGDPRANARLVAMSGAQSVLHQPITGPDGTIAILTVAWQEPVDSLQDRKAAIVGLIAHEAAIALRRRESLAQLERAALVDPLTGVANRRAFDAELPAALRRATAEGHPLALVMMDLNEFKAVNDLLGHEAGDEVLISAASAWADALRAGDLLARLGGDEFAVLLPTCDETEMGHIARRLRSATPHGPGASMGGVIWDGTETAASLIRRADAAQYDDKARCKAADRSNRNPRGASTAPMGPRFTDPRSN